jgi:GH24 family phage-related lysozyme (muramidase)
MASSGVLKEFLVKIGFKVDEQKYKRFQESMGSTAKNAADMTKNFVKLGEASLLAGTAMGTALTAAAKQLEGLYFASQRTGASAKELQTFSFAAEQVGVSAEQARAAVEGLAVTRRTSPGVNGLLGSFGIDPRQTDNAKVLVQLITRLHSMPEFQGAQVAKMFGIDQSTFLQLNKNLPEMQKALAMREKLFSQTGVDPDKADKSGHEFMMQVRLMGAALQDVSEIIAVRLMPWAEVVVGWVDKFAVGIGKADKATGGWSSKLIGLGIAAKALATSWSIIGKISGFGGKAAAGAAEKAAGAAAGEAAAGGEAAAASGGLMAILKRVAGLSGRSALGGAAEAGGAAAAGEVAAGGAAVAGEAVAGGGLAAAATALLPVLIPLLIGAAAIAAIGWVVTHPMQARKAAGWVKDEAVKGAGWVKTESKKAAVATGHAISKEAHALPSQLHETLRVMAETPHRLSAAVTALANIPGQFAPIKALPGLISDVAQFTARMEGHVKNGYGLYKDIAGHLTVGFGHLVQKGEDFSGGLDKQGALALLAKDMQSAFSAVKGLVHGNLGANQMKALADLAFNIGTAAFSHSTLLKELNAGHMGAAADQFAHWNKVLVNGHYVANQGLANRRAAEAQLFRTPDKGVTITQKTDIHIEGRDAAATGQEVFRQQSRVNGDLVRNFAGATQ